MSPDTRKWHDGFFLCGYLLLSVARYAILCSDLVINMKSPSKIFLALFLIAVISVFPETAEAQCAMCKAAAESNLKNGGTDGLGLNNGILYMLATPYLLIGGIIYMYWRNRKKNLEVLDA